MIKYFSDLVGHTIVKIDREDSDYIGFTLEDGTKCHLYHEQDCCENVRVDETKGRLSDLLGQVIIKATEDNNEREQDKLIDNSCSSWRDSWTRTTYTLETVDNKVVISWLGESNGYYSEDVNLHVIPPKG